MVSALCPPGFPNASPETGTRTVAMASFTSPCPRRGARTREQRRQAGLTQPQDSHNPEALSGHGISQDWVQEGPHPQVRSCRGRDENLPILPRCCTRHTGLEVMFHIMVTPTHCGEKKGIKSLTIHRKIQCRSRVDPSLPEQAGERCRGPQRGKRGTKHKY